MIQAKNENEDLLLSVTKNCETLIEQTRTKTQETLDFKTTRTKETFSFKRPISIEGSWMTELTNLEVYNSFFTITEENTKFELYTDIFDEFSFKELKDELEDILSISDITPKHLQDEKLGSRVIKAYKKVRSEKSSNHGYVITLMGYGRSPFRDLEG